MKRLTGTNQKGFTIVELMIATAVFSIVLLILTTGVLSFTRQYYKGILNNRTQNVARSTVREISQSVQFSAGDITPITNIAGQVAGYCINDRPYYFQIGRQLNGSVAGTKTNHALITGTKPCLTEAPSLINADLNSSDFEGFRELLGDKMRLAYFKVTPQSDGSTEVSIRVVYGDDDLLCTAASPNSCNVSATLTPSVLTNPAGDKTLQCKGKTGTQFCSSIGLSTKVVKRVE